MFPAAAHRAARIQVTYLHGQSSIAF